MRAKLLVCLLASGLVGFAAACSDSTGGSSDASGVAGANGGSGAGGTGGGQAGNAAAGRGGGGGQAGTSAGGSGGGAGQAGSSAGAGGGGSAGSGGQAGGTAGSGGRGGAGGQAGGSAGAGGRGGTGGQAGGSAGAGGRGGTGGGTFCSMLPGMTWLSTTDQECGNAPDGGARCRWRLTFTTANVFSWQHSDYVEAGSYTCNGTTVTGQRLGGGTTIAGLYDMASQTLTWDGLAYTPQ